MEKKEKPQVKTRAKRDLKKDAWGSPVKESVESTRIQTSKGVTKIKYFRKKEYANGAVKNAIIGLEKDGRMLFGVKE